MHTGWLWEGTRHVLYLEQWCCRPEGERKRRRSRQGGGCPRHGRQQFGRRCKQPFQAALMVSVRSIAHCTPLSRKYIVESLFTPGHYWSWQIRHGALYTHASLRPGGQYPPQVISILDPLILILTPRRSSMRNPASTCRLELLLNWAFVNSVIHLLPCHYLPYLYSSLL